MIVFMVIIAMIFLIAAIIVILIGGYQVLIGEKETESFMMTGLVLTIGGLLIAFMIK
jgi:hypothetical protein